MKYRGNTGLIFSLTLLENGYLASGSWDNTIKIWDVVSKSMGYCLWKIEIYIYGGHSNYVL